MSGFNLEFFDACVEIGPRTVRDEDQPWTLEDYRTDMEHFGIAEAVVYHSVAKEYDPAEGNRRLLEEVQGDVRLHPQWILLPPDTGELPPPEELAAEMRARGVSSARLCPGQHHYPLEEYFLGDLLGVLEDAATPLFLEQAEAPWPQVVKICTEHPRLQVVTTRTRYRETRVLPSLLKKLPNLHVDTAVLADHCILEEYGRRFGPGRFVYSSSWPFLSPASAMTLIGYAGLDEAGKRAVASQNLRRMLQRRSP